MSRPTPLSGFPELLPAERNAELAVIEHLQRIFELHGYANIETRTVEPLERLLSKGEIDKEVYVLRRLQADEESSDAGVGLHYDLTVPFARYVLESAGKLEFPFRRYQIQKAWRGERPQEGRYREFTQADIDVIARDELPFHYDVEVARVISEALSGLPIPAMCLQINNRKLIEGFYRGIGADDPSVVMQAVDKLDKMPAAAVADLLVERGLTPDQARSCLALAEISTPDASFVDRVRALGVEHPLLETGLDELRTVVEASAELANDRFSVSADLRIARGLDYYTGTVFETRLTGFESLGSICSGGRYDALATDGSTTYPGVGISFGVTRTLVPLFQRGLLTSTRSVPSVVLVALVSPESRAESDAIAGQLRARGIATEVAASAQRFGKQIRYAERRGIPFVWFPANGDVTDQVRDIRSGTQVDANDSWRPPDEDLRPQVVNIASAESSSPDASADSSSPAAIPDSASPDANATATATAKEIRS
jgi:histidyl-tRNA synthetase